MGFVAIAISVFITAYIISCLINYIKLRKIINKIPGPFNHFLLGNVLQFKQDPEGNISFKIGRMSFLTWQPFDYVFINMQDGTNKAKASPFYGLVHACTEFGSRLFLMSF